MYLGFDLYRDDSIKDLDERINKINTFLSKQLSSSSDHRHFGVFLLAPKRLVASTSMFYLAKCQSRTQYRLCIEFFPDKHTAPIPELELVYDLGKTSDYYDYLQSDVKAISYLSAYTDQVEVIFIKTPIALSILFKFDDNNPNIKRIKNHLEFLIPDIFAKN